MITRQDDRYALVVAVALSLYGYNVAPHVRADALWRQFEDEFSEYEALLKYMHRPGMIATELPAHQAQAYVANALEVYGAQAAQRVERNLRRSLVSPDRPPAGG